jgi:c-di-GMP-binding flagellar brake protein YcgR
MPKELRKVIGVETPPAAADTEQFLAERKQIVGLLIQAYKAHVLLNVSFKGQKTHFSTALLGIYDEHGFLVLDELTPQSGHDLALKLKRMHLTGRLQGVDLSFSSDLIEAREKNGIAFYKVKLPKRIRYLQRRQDFRVSSSGSRIRFHALRGKGTKQILRGYVHDLSRKGVGVILEDDVDLQQGEVLSNCIISIPGRGDALFSLEIRFISNGNRKRLTRVGGCFKEIGSESLQKIRNTLNQMERVQARRLHGV